MAFLTRIRGDLSKKAVYAVDTDAINFYQTSYSKNNRKEFDDAGIISSYSFTGDC